ncbi:MAG: ATP-binding protein [Chloroflexi bacterium]|nr:ATP-binding protein [Chloroflexota bacterium]
MGLAFVKQLQDKLAGVWQRLTEPHASILEPGQRSRARLLAGLLLSFALIILIISGIDLYDKQLAFEPDRIPFENILIPGFLLMVGIYWLSRTRYFKMAARALILLGICLIFADIIAVRESVLDIAYLIFGVLMASLFFSWRTTILTLGGLMLSLLAIPSLTDVPWGTIFNAETFLLVVGLLIITIAGLREQDQASLLAQALALEEREAALQAGEQKYRSLVNEISDGIFETDAQGRLTFANLALIKTFGFEHPAALLGRSFFEFVSPETKAEAAEDFKAFVAGMKEFETISLEILLPDGSSRFVEGRPARILANGEVVGTRGMLRDITERKQAEAELLQSQALLEQRVVERTAELEAANILLEKAARLKDEFLASMSHELRTPLTGILGLSDVLQLQTFGKLSERQSAALEHINSSGRHLLDLINDILDYSKIEAHQLSLHYAPCQVMQICNGGLKAVSKQTTKKKMQTSISIFPPDLVIQADPTRLKQMLTNLLSNAIKFTPAGGSLGIEVTCSLEERLARITVWDSGIGIRAEDMPRLFQSFVQLDASLARRYNGTGLGLVLVHRLAGLHGGSVRVESDFGGGSRFTISLPWQPVDEAAGQLSGGWREPPQIDES